MHRFPLTALLLAVLLLVPACDSFLEVEPETFVSTDDFYENESQVALAVNGLYADLQGLYGTLQWAYGEFRSDNTSFQFNPNDRGGSSFEAIDWFLLSADNGNIAGYWNNAYNGIARANFILASIEDVPFQDEAAKAQRAAEARFFRAFHYFNLVRLFTDVPIVTEPVVSPAASAEFQRQPVEEVYNQVILPDLQDAVAGLPDVAMPFGRLTKGAARTLLAKAYLEREDWAAAEEQLRAIVASGQYMLLPNYADIFVPSNANNAEIIFSIQYVGGNDDGEDGSFMVRFAPFNSGTQVIGQGVEGFNGVGSRSGLNQPTQSIIDAYEEGDVRKAASVGEFAVVSPEGETTAVEPYIEKYCCYMVKAGQESTNWPVFRYADVLLMLAEALLEQGNAAEGLTYVNEVRARAGLDGLAALTEEALWQERRVELAFENHRWFDLVRWGIAEETMRAHGEQQKALKPGIIPPEAYVNISTRLAIPAAEVQAWGYEQNQEWVGGGG